MSTIRFEKTTILGPGLIGASLGLAIKEAGLAVEITGVGRSKDSLSIAQKIGAIDKSTLNPIEGVEDADLVVLATNITTALTLGIKVMPHLKPNCLLIDVASAKTYLISGLLKEIPSRISYVSVHPMAGSEKKGPEFARADLFREALCILTPTSATKEGDLVRMRDYWNAIGSRTRVLEATTHDRWLAECSHLPHLASTALVNTVSPEAMECSATGFRDATRLASGDVEVWQDIGICNNKELSTVLRRYSDEILSLAEALDVENESEIFEKLNSAKIKRDDFYEGKD